MHLVAVLLLFLLGQDIAASNRTPDDNGRRPKTNGQRKAYLMRVIAQTEKNLHMYYPGFS